MFSIYEKRAGDANRNLGNTPKVLDIALHLMGIERELLGVIELCAGLLLNELLALLDDFSAVVIVGAAGDSVAVTHRAFIRALACWY